MIEPTEPMPSVSLLPVLPAETVNTILTALMSAEGALDLVYRKTSIETYGHALAQVRVVLGAVAVGLFLAVVGWVAVAFRLEPWALPTAGFWRASSTVTYANANAAMLVPLAVLVAALLAARPRSRPLAMSLTLLLAGCELAELSSVGDGKHLRFRVRQNGRDAGSAIAFGFGPQLDRLQGQSRYDVVFRLKENRWNGTVAPQLVVRRVFDAPASYEELRSWLAGMWKAGEEAWTPEAKRIFGELELTEAAGPRQLLESETFRALLEHGAPLTLPEAA
jgi:hypothetical protein